MNAKVGSRSRIHAIDSLRGLAIALMILVNTPGSWQHVYGALTHAPWHGFRIADAVFPIFLFVVGIGMYLSLQRTRDLSLAMRQMKIIRRAILLVLIGIGLNAYPFTAPWSELRIMGVLQRIGLAYGIAASLSLYLGVRLLWVVAALLLLAYWLLLHSLGGAEPYAMASNIARQVDIALLGSNHMWWINDTAFDPEGLLSTVPAAVSVLGGYLAGAYLLTTRLQRDRVKRLFLAAVALLLVGLIWHPLWPINKSLWTGSYVAFSSGLALSILCLLLWLQEIKGYQAPFKALIIYGRNPLFVYILSWLWTATLLSIPIGNETLAASNAYAKLYEYFLHIASPGMASLWFALAHVALFWLVAWGLYRKNIVINL